MHNSRMADNDRAHLIAGGFPRGTAAGHDIDYARLRLLEVLAEHPNVQATVASDYTDIESWLGAMRGLQRRFFGGG